MRGRIMLQDFMSLLQSGGRACVARSCFRTSCLSYRVEDGHAWPDHASGLHVSLTEWRTGMRGQIMLQDFMSLLQSGGRVCVAGSCFRTSCLSYRVEDGHAWPDHASGLHVSLTEWRTGMRGQIMLQDFMSLLQSGGRACVAGSCFRTSCLSYRVEDGHAWPDHASGLHVSLTEWRTGMRGQIMLQDFMSLLQSGGRACVARSCFRTSCLSYRVEDGHAWPDHVSGLHVSITEWRTGMRGQIMLQDFMSLSLTEWRTGMRGRIMLQDFMSLLQSGGRACVARSYFRTSCLSYRVEDGHAWPDHVSGLHVSITEWRTGMRGQIMLQDFMSLLQSGGRACVARSCFRTSCLSYRVEDGHAWPDHASGLRVSLTEWRTGMRGQIMLQDFMSLSLTEWRTGMRGQIMLQDFMSLLQSGGRACVAGSCFRTSCLSYRVEDGHAWPDHASGLHVSLTEWRTGMRGRIMLQDVDTTSKCEAECKRYNTLAHYCVLDGDWVTMIPKQNSSQNLSVCSSQPPPPSARYGNTDVAATLAHR